MRSRDEHVLVCKVRARACLDRGELLQAVTSMMSDLEKHDETKQVPGNRLFHLGIMYAQGGDAAGVRRWIDGFN